jgi:hypothetical protein
MLASFLVIYDGPTAADEVKLMTAIQSLASQSFDLCYKTILLKSELNAFQLGKLIHEYLETNGSPLGNNDRLVIAQVEPSKLPTFA